MHTLERQQWVPTPLAETFEFFSRAENLGLLTPPWLGFEILTPTPIPMCSGAIIDYKITMHGVPMRWKTRIEAWNFGESFVDRQVVGPYREWVHTHTFQAMDGGTLITDVVRYRLPFGFFGRIAHSVSVRAKLAAIFDYRYHAIRNVLGGSERTTTTRAAQPEPVFEGAPNGGTPEASASQRAGAVSTS